MVQLELVPYRPVVQEFYVARVARCPVRNPAAFELYGIRNTDKDISKSRRRIGAVVETPSIYLDMTADRLFCIVDKLLCVLC